MCPYNEATDITLLSGQAQYTNNVFESSSTHETEALWACIFYVSCNMHVHTFENRPLILFDYADQTTGEASGCVSYVFAPLHVAAGYVLGHRCPSLTQLCPISCLCSVATDHSMGFQGWIDTRVIF